MDRLAQSETVQGPSVDTTSAPLTQAAAVACAYLRETRQTKKSQAFRVLAELAQWTLERNLEGRSTEFTAANLRAGVAPDIAKEASGWLSPLWTRLVELESEWQEGLVETARVMGLAFTPRLSKQDGSPAYYSLEAISLPVDGSQGPVAEIPEGGVRYTPETVAAPAAWLNGALKVGVVRWTFSLRWALLVILLLATFLALGMLWLVFATGLRTTRPLSLADLLGILVAVGLAIGLIPVYRFLDELFDLRIVMAPSALTSFAHEAVTLEVRRRDSEDDVGELAFVRYTAICPLCDATVTIHSGRREFPDRLIGRCHRSGREHIFSFDHVLRVGYPLR